MPIFIPSKVRIAAKTFDVVFDTQLNINHSHAGQIRYREQKIYLQPDTECDPRHHESIEDCFFHEILHGILNEMGYPDLCNDESFVNRIATTLYAALRDSGMLVKAGPKEDA